MKSIESLGSKVFMGKIKCNAFTYLARNTEPIIYDF
jgi:hypothetical protein